MSGLICFPTLLRFKKKPYDISSHIFNFGYICSTSCQRVGLRVQSDISPLFK